MSDKGQAADLAAEVFAMACKSHQPHSSHLCTLSPLSFMDVRLFSFVPFFAIMYP
jgi:hypothetical protein